jgi:putative SOS response-associated peptidase YedK
MRLVLTQPQPVSSRFNTVNEIPRREPNYNIRPGMKTAFVFTNRSGDNVLFEAVFGLVPPWDSRSDAYAYPSIHCDRVIERPTWRESFTKTRCLAIVDGFFVWDNRQPYFVRYKSRQLFGIAAIYAENKYHRLYRNTCAILTTYPNDLVAQVNKRMPVIIKPEDEARYLIHATPLQEVVDMLVPVSEDDLEMYAITRGLNRSTKNLIRFIRRLEELDLSTEEELEDNSGQLSFFKF